jgi:hypothetical protein
MRPLNIPLFIVESRFWSSLLLLFIYNILYIKVSKTIIINNKSYNKFNYKHINNSYLIILNKSIKNSKYNNYYK